MKEEKKVKIVATIGPACDSEKMIEELIHAGVNIFRFNTKHSDNEWHKKRIDLVDSIRKRLNKNIGILMDLQGPEIRIETKNKEEIILKKGETIYFGANYLAKEKSVKVSNKIIFKNVKKGTKFLLEDGTYEFEVVTKKIDGVILKANENVVIRHRKGLNILDTKIDLPSLTKDDLEKLDIAKNGKVNFIALSFCRSKKDLDILKNEIEKRKIKASIMSKIESHEAINNLDEIIKNSDCIMVARGDLGIQTPLEHLAINQKLIIGKCLLANKPVITATQMLQSMVENKIPTRAEATDVANAVLDGTDAVMLSAETANGSDPLNVIKTMHRLVEANESYVHSYDPLEKQIEAKSHMQLLARAVAQISEDMKTKENKIDKIIIFTETGFTAREISTFKLKQNVLAVTNNKNTYYKLSMSYGIEARLIELSKTADIKYFIEKLEKIGDIKKGNNVLILSGDSIKIKGTENFMTILKV